MAVAAIETGVPAMGWQPAMARPASAVVLMNGTIHCKNIKVGIDYYEA